VSCVGDGEEARRICYEIATGGEKIKQPINEVAIFSRKAIAAPRHCASIMDLGGSKIRRW
jgi:hypothetical protein